MGRTAKYSVDDILDAALDVISEDGANSATVVAVAAKLGAPSGSIYHRFASHDLILAALWIRTVKRFQTGFLAALALPPESAVSAAVFHTLEWTAAHRREAKVLILYRREDLIALWPDELGDDLRVLNDGVKRAVVALAASLFGSATARSVGKTRFALIDLPYAAARQILLNDDMPPVWLGETVLTASLAILRDEGRER